jgi:hypothetical protein
MLIVIDDGETDVVVVAANSQNRRRATANEPVAFCIDLWGALSE